MGWTATDYISMSAQRAASAAAGERGLDFSRGLRACWRLHADVSRPESSIEHATPLGAATSNV